MMEFLNWASANPGTLTLILLAVVMVAYGLGQIGTTKHYHGKSEEDE